MTQNTAEYQAKMYLYDLHNCARENGFKADEKWHVGLATDEEKIVIENKYNPTVAVKVAPAVLSEMFGLVKQQLQQTKPDSEEELSTDKIRVNQIHYLIAFSEKKVRR